MANLLSFTRPISEITNITDFRWLMSGNCIMFGNGRFDGFCAWYGRFDGMQGDTEIMCCAPQDMYYFNIVEYLGRTVGYQKVYEDIKHFYEHTNNKVDDKVVDTIRKIAAEYGRNMDFAYNAFMQIYYGMIAEENKENRILGKAIKLNGLHRVLIEKVPIEIAVKECCGQPYTEIQKQCQANGIRRFVSYE